MPRQSSDRQRPKLLNARAPHKGTVIIAAAFYIFGLFGLLGFIPMPALVSSIALAIAGGLLLLGVFLRRL